MLYKFTQVTTYINYLYNNSLTFPGKEEYLGRVELNLSELCVNVTHDIWRNIEDSQGSIHLIMTIIGTEDGISQIADVNDVNLTHKYVRRKASSHLKYITIVYLYRLMTTHSGVLGMLAMLCYKFTKQLASDQQISLVLVIPLLPLNLETNSSEL